MELSIRVAGRDDVPRIVQLLGDDDLGQRREAVDQEPGFYDRAFAAIESDPNNEVLVAEQDGEVVGCFQLTYIPYLTYQGSWRALIEGVRVSRELRGQGAGERMMQWAIERARQRGCRIVQLTTDKRRPAAHRFYLRLGFVNSHEGMKLHLSADA